MGSTRLDGIEFYAKKFMIHHRMELYNPVIWVGRKTLVSPCQDVLGNCVFVFQPEKRQQDSRKTCQGQQAGFGARVKHIGVSHVEFMTGKAADDKQAQLGELVQRLQQTPAKPKSAPASEGFRQEELVSQAAPSSSSQQWQTSQSQSWWSGWEWTAGQERWWEQTEWVQWQEPPATSAAEAKQKAKSEKRAKQKALKEASGINVTKLKLCQVHLGDIRIAQKLWEVFPHDENTTDPVHKFAGGIRESLMICSRPSRWSMSLITDGDFGCSRRSILSTQS